MKYYIKLKYSLHCSEVSKDVYYSKRRSNNYYCLVGVRNGLIVSRTLVEK